MKKIIAGLVVAVALSVTITVTALTTWAQVGHGNGWDYETGCHNHFYDPYYPGADSPASLAHDGLVMDITDRFCKPVSGYRRGYEGGSYAHAHKGYTRPSDPPPQQPNPPVRQPDPPARQPNPPNPLPVAPTTAPSSENPENVGVQGDSCAAAKLGADTDEDGEVSLTEAVAVANNYFDTPGAPKEPVICVLDGFGRYPCSAAIAEADTDEDGEISLSETLAVVNNYFDTQGASIEPVICVVIEYLSD